jgi:hypothetical protein
MTAQVSAESLVHLPTAEEAPEVARWLASNTHSDGVGSDPTE